MDNQRSLKEIAEEIIQDWQYPHQDAIPYLDKMRTMTSIDDLEFASIDDLEIGMTVVDLFLYNASSWHGPEADRIRKELNTMLIFMWYLCNAHSWRGPTARRIKKELRDMLASARLQPGGSR